VRERTWVDAVPPEHVAERCDEEIESRLDVPLARGTVAHGHAAVFKDA
jgi:hypothetical protein